MTTLSDSPSHEPTVQQCESVQLHTSEEGRLHLHPLFDRLRLYRLSCFRAAKMSEASPCTRPALQGRATAAPGFSISEFRALCAMQRHDMIASRRQNVPNPALRKEQVELNTFVMVFWQRLLQVTFSMCILPLRMPKKVQELVESGIQTVRPSEVEECS